MKTNTKPKCEICNKDGVFGEYEENELAIKVNPLTFKTATMHVNCLDIALYGIKGVPSNEKKYKDKYQEYIDKYL